MISDRAFGLIYVGALLLIIGIVLTLAIPVDDKALVPAHVKFVGGFDPKTDGYTACRWSAKDYSMECMSLDTFIKQLTGAGEQQQRESL